ncbi:MAG: glutathione S-transferase N-terminal domain-containing protein [Alphaproteobacteria bacterium]|nr:glutathione S-transferase N-terminal domain-containing protein [Alphaproteobacteria bacterium]
MTTFLPVLYSFRRCPYAMRARLALYSAKIGHEHREVDLKNKPPEMLKISPKGTVPMLQLVDGTALDQSLDIMKWALKDPFLSSEDKELIEENDTTFKQALDRYKYPGRYSEEKNVNYRDLGEIFLKKLETRLRPCAGGPTFLDMAVFPFVRQISKVDQQWFEAQSYPYLTYWLDSITSSALFQHVMQKSSPWSTGDDPITISF